MKLASTLALAAVIGLSGCATILNEPTQTVNVSSSTGSPIKGSIDGTPFTAPGPVQVKRANANKVVIVETDGCAQQTVMEKSVDTKFFINILSGGAFGSTTDYTTEKMWKYNDSVVVSCSK
ncbi:hypothetical protein KSF73_04560 [Burkholderiaceae bacterium DAT-1]|nr:hypothetical protein [Burkholderiaceae bacterium DAT-1]